MNVDVSGITITSVQSKSVFYCRVVYVTDKIERLMCLTGKKDTRTDNLHHFHENLLFTILTETTVLE